MVSIWTYDRASGFGVFWIRTALPAFLPFLGGAGTWVLGFGVPVGLALPNAAGASGAVGPVSVVGADGGGPGPGVGPPLV